MVQPLEDWNGHNSPGAPQIGLTPIERFFAALGGRLPFLGSTTADQGAMPSSIALRSQLEQLSAPVTVKKRRR